MNKISIIIAGLISLFGYSVAQTSADNKYESLILRYLENEDNDELLNYLINKRFFRGSKIEKIQTDEQIVPTHSDEDIVKQIAKADQNGYQVSYGGKKFNLCDPLVVALVGKTSYESFKKYYRILCSSNKVGDVIASYSKNGKLKALVQAYRGGIRHISPDVLERIFGKRDFGWKSNWNDYDSIIKFD